MLDEKITWQYKDPVTSFFSLSDFSSAKLLLLDSFLP